MLKDLASSMHVSMCQYFIATCMQSEHSKLVQCVFKRNGNCPSPPPLVPKRGISSHLLRAQDDTV